MTAGEQHESNTMSLESISASAIYRPLKQTLQETRLLRILPATDPGVALQCQIEYTSLHSTTSYEALSYCWGSDKKPDTIVIVQGHQRHVLPVTSSLFAALLQLRRSNTDRLLWIDAVCINQSDVIERSREVLRMFEIYSRASNVVIWLGEEADDSTLGLEHLHHLSRDTSLQPYNVKILIMISRLRSILITIYTIIACTLTASKDKPLGTAWVVLVHSFLPSSGLLSWALWLSTVWPLVSIIYGTGLLVLQSDWFLGYPYESMTDELYMPSEKVAIALRAIFARPWFTRIWIVQEVAAGQNATLKCGRAELSWSAFCVACKEMSLRITKSQKQNPYAETLFWTTLSLQQLTGDKTHGSDENEHGILWLLSKLRSCDATDPRDKIYALLGLSHERAHITPLIAPDYNKPVEHVYANLVRSMVRHTDNLDVLRLIDGVQTRSGLPTWAPDWSIYVHHRWENRIPSPKPYCLSSDPQPDLPVARFADDLRTMTVRGFIMGYLKGDGDLLYSSQDSDLQNKLAIQSTETNVMWKWAAPLLVWLFNSGMIQWCTRPLMWTILYFYLDQKMIESCVEVALDFIDQATMALLQLPENERKVLPTMQNLCSLQATRSVDQTFLWELEWESSLPHSTFDVDRCETSASAPRHGDLTCMFIGSQEAHLLRRVGDKYRLLGDANFRIFNKPLWKDCDTSHKDGTIDLVEFDLV